MRLPLLIFYLLLYNSCLAQTTKSQFSKQLDELIYREHRVDFDKTYGVIIGIIEGDSTYVFSYGSIQKDTMILPKSKHLFQIGSLTQVLTATQYWDLQQKGHYQLNEPIHRYLPSEYHNKDTSITFLQLLSHTSGLPRLPNDLAKKQQLDNQPFANYTKEDILIFYKNYDFTIPPKDNYTFSYVAYALLGAILPKQASINSSSNDCWVQGYDKAGNPTATWQNNGFDAALGAAASMDELLSFLQQHINSTKYLSLYQEQAPTGIRKNTAVGLGWHIVKRKRKTPPIIVHTGATNGFRAYMAFEPKMRRGVIVLSNSEFGLHGLGYTILTTK